MKPPFIKAELHTRGVTLTNIAERLEVTPSAVSKVIAGHKRSRRIAGEIARVIGKPITSIWPSQYRQSVRVRRGMK